MNCPKCHSKFETVTFSDIQVERCLGCQGLWFDMCEKENLAKVEGSESIDIGNDKVGEEYDDIDNINCPHCTVKMIPMVDKDQAHLKFESCTVCYGTFLDAGEFCDLKDHSVVERIFEILKTLRTNL